MKAKDLAKQLGVSPATISLVLNNKPGISDSLRRSLLEKIEALGHEDMLCPACREGAAPGEAPAASGGEGVCRSIAFLVYQDRDGYPDVRDPNDYFFSGVLEGIEAEAWDNGCCLVMLHANPRKNVSVAEQLRRSGNIIGAILHPCAMVDQALRDLQEAKLPCVFIDSYGMGECQPPAVCVSNRQGMDNVVRYLTEKGHRDIGYVFSGWETEVERDRRQWYKWALEQYGVEDRDEFYFCAGTGVELFEYQRLAALFAQAERLPTALACENDRQAWRAVKALQSLGKRVPEDMSVVGFDDMKLCTKIEPNLTTVSNSPQLMGRQCVIMLKNLLRLRELGDPEPWLRYELPARLVERDSVRDMHKNNQ